MKNQSLFRKVRYQLGVTILEFIAFIGLAAIVIAGALSLYGSASSSSRASDLVRVAQGMVATLQSTYATSSITNWATAGQALSAPTGWDGTLAVATKGPYGINIWGTGRMTVDVYFGDSKIGDAVGQATINGVKGTFATGGSIGNGEYVRFSGITP